MTRLIQSATRFAHFIASVVFVMEPRKRADLALGSSLRSWLGWRVDLGKEESTRIKHLANELVECGEKLSKGKNARSSYTPMSGRISVK